MKLVDPFPDRYWDLAPVAATSVPTVPRRIGLLDNTKGTADMLLDEVGRQLEASLGAPTVRHHKELFSRPAPDHLLRSLTSQCDLVITAVGD